MRDDGLFLLCEVRLWRSSDRACEHALWLWLLSRPLGLLAFGYAGLGLTGRTASTSIDPWRALAKPAFNAEFFIGATASCEIETLLSSS